MDNFLSDKIYFFNNRQIEIIDQFPSFNLAIVKYINTLEEFTVDINFINVTYSKENYLTYRI